MPLPYASRLELLSDAELEQEARDKYTLWLALHYREREKPQMADAVLAECVRRDALPGATGEYLAMWRRVVLEVKAARARELAARTPAPPALRDAADEIPQ